MTESYGYVENSKLICIKIRDLNRQQYKTYAQLWFQCHHGCTQTPARRDTFQLSARFVFSAEENSAHPGITIARFEHPAFWEYGHDATTRSAGWDAHHDKGSFSIEMGTAH
ncbi:hypothetical protein [Advenella sp. S44]|uniref:hypothetical protein n=1 Tax=Advenella sp. S44 TaxID=1982755 RepID=UPI001290095D|nr:hypothetical protein [Advenella sp. S44]